MLTTSRSIRTLLALLALPVATACEKPSFDVTSEQSSNCNGLWAPWRGAAKRRLVLRGDRVIDDSTFADAVVFRLTLAVVSDSCPSSCAVEMFGAAAPMVSFYDVTEFTPTSISVSFAGRKTGADTFSLVSDGKSGPRHLHPAQSTGRANRLHHASNSALRTP